MHAFLNSELATAAEFVAIKGQMQVNFLTSAEERDQTATSYISNHGKGTVHKRRRHLFPSFLVPPTTMLAGFLNNPL